jgi:hypothetical protein
MIWLTFSEEMRGCLASFVMVPIWLLSSEYGGGTLEEIISPFNEKNHQHQEKEPHTYRGTTERYMNLLNDGKFACVDDNLMDSMWT